MQAGPVEEITASNVERIYKKAAQEGHINTMMAIDESKHCVHIDAQVRLEAILSILRIAPHIIAQYYLTAPFAGITDVMRKKFVDFAILHGVIAQEGSDLYLPNFQRQANTTASQTMSNGAPTKRRFTI